MAHWSPGAAHSPADFVRIQAASLSPGAGSSYGRPVSGVGGSLIGIAAHGLRHGLDGPNAAVLLLSVAIVAVLCTALSRHRIRLSRAEAIRVAAWSIGLFLCWEAMVVGAYLFLLVRSLSLGV